MTFIVAGGEMPRISKDLMVLSRAVMRRNGTQCLPIMGGEFGYGDHWNDAVFMMRPFCWCEKKECGWCDYPGGSEFPTNPNFEHRTSGVRVWWYKYIGRGMKVENSNSVDLRAAIRECLRHVKGIKQ